MSEPKTTDGIRMIAAGVAARQAEICTARRENLEDKIESNTSTVAANAAAITALTAAMAKQTTAFTSSIDVIKVRTTITAVISSSLPVILVLAWQWFSNK